MASRRHEAFDGRKLRSYTATVVEALVHGEVDGALGPVDAPSWAELRSSVEHHGDMESEGFLEVMDFEMALRKLAQAHPEAAVVISALQMVGLHPDTLPTALGTHRNWGRITQKGKAWLTSYLAGKEPPEWEIAYRRAR